MTFRLVALHAAPPLLMTLSVRSLIASFKLASISAAIRCHFELSPLFVFIQKSVSCN
jgi:hypothetical protein